MTQNRTSSAKAEGGLSSDARTVLQRFGLALDAGQPIVVHRHGIVSLGDEVSQPQCEKELNDELQGTRGPTAGARQGPARRQGTAGASPQVGQSSLQESYEGSLPALRLAYPGTRVWDDEHGLWIVVSSSPLGLDGPQVVLILGLPYSAAVKPRAWAFWGAGDSARWVGPRHTNFPDGSICAFGEDDGSWAAGDDLSKLVDLYMVWVVCQLHLREFRRWPGQQHAFNSYYRLIEFQEGERCSCESGRLYTDCHRPHDLIMDQAAAKRAFEAWAKCAINQRQPPKVVVKFAKTKFRTAPTLLDAFNGR